ncbi:MAG: 2-hydroxyglutaryl-CoA dehydratase [Candidatus Lokiarchaeota archaeon]|nr:2-hydroxyglutaryl-CoA dehydratase [Candidatus Lokiarchaeota archaeon]
MKYAGIDIGSLTGKAVIIEGGRILSSVVVHVKRNPVLTSEEVYRQALAMVNLEPGDVAFCVGTGYGREKIPFANKTLSEISCHGKGAHSCDPAIRTIIDVGGQDCKAITIDDAGNLKDFVMNDKCAAGTGRYLELMADLLGLTLDDLGTLSLKTRTPVQLTSVCSIYAQAEVLQLISQKSRKEDIAAGVNSAMAERAAMLARKLVLREKMAVTGGVAKNKGVVQNLERFLGVKFAPLPVDPQIIGALGAAHIAQESHKT